jgi:hypothetical protein
MKMKLVVEANKPRRADCYSSRGRGMSRNKNCLPRRSDCIGGSFLVCPESAVKNGIEF